MEKAEQLTW